ncbi:MAG TPA: PEGA domain-containing protein [Vicinamibacterales bacterium]
MKLRRFGVTIDSPSPEEFSLHTDAAGTAPPEAFGPFRVLHQIGAGALGPVFRAFDPDRDRLVAVKLFRLDLPPERVHQLVAEFERLIAAAVTHPAVIAPVATGIAGVNAYLAQDYVVAESLDITLRQGPASVADALRVASQLAGALDAAAAVHIEHGVLHPRDVLLSADGARLTGLGIARAVEHVGVPTQVRRPYTAPERAIGSEWGGRADVFGLAAIIHEMLWARRVAATGDEAAGSLTDIEGGDLPRLRAVFGRALADNPAERFGTALEFAGALKEAFNVVRSVRPSADRRSLGVGGQPDRRSGIESEPRLPLEPPAAVEKNVEKAVEKEPELVAMRADLDLRLPVLPPELIDSYRPAPDSLLADGQSRSAISPLAFALLIGAALGFVAGFGVGTWGRSSDQSDVAAAPTAGPVREFTEAEIAVKPSATAGQPDTITEAPPAPKPAPPPIIGSLLVRSTPLGARVLVDGREYGRTPLTVSNLSRGEHSVRVIRDGYVADERLVTITSAQRAHSVTARLAPERVAPVRNAVNAAKATTPENSTNSTSSPGAAPLTVESRPAGAKVFIDGRLVGTTPLVVPAVTAGEHALYLDRDGYQRWSSAIRIVTTDKNRVTASLDR